MGKAAGAVVLNRAKGDILPPLRGRERSLKGKMWGHNLALLSAVSGSFLQLPHLLGHQHLGKKVSGDFPLRSLPPTTLPAAPVPLLPSCTQNPLLLFFLNLIFSGSESRSKEEILSSLLGIIPRLSHWKCIHNYQNYFFETSFLLSYPFLFRLCCRLGEEGKDGSLQSAFVVAG